MVDQIRSVVLLVLLNYFILALWRVFGRPTILMRLGGPKKVMKGLGINLKSSKEYEPCKEVMPSRKLNYNVVCKTKCNVKPKKISI